MKISLLMPALLSLSLLVPAPATAADWIDLGYGIILDNTPLPKLPPDADEKARNHRHAVIEERKKREQEAREEVAKLRKLQDEEYAGWERVTRAQKELDSLRYEMDRKSKTEEEYLRMKRDIEWKMRELERLKSDASSAPFTREMEKRDRERERKDPAFARERREKEMGEAWEEELRRRKEWGRAREMLRNDAEEADRKRREEEAGWMHIFRSGKQCGYANFRGTPVIAARFDDCVDFRENVARVKVGGKWGFVDRTGKEVVPPQYDYAWDSYSGKARVRIGEEVREIVLPPYTGPLPERPPGPFIISVQGETPRELAKSLPPFPKNDPRSRERRIYRSGTRCGFTDSRGNTVIEARYDDCMDFRENVARVKVDGKWGFIDRSGNMVVSPQYDYVWDSYSGKARVRTGEEVREIVLPITAGTLP